MNLNTGHLPETLNSAYAGVAQLVEHLPEEQRVGGSSPPPSTYTKTHPFLGVFLYIAPELEGRTEWSEGVGAGATQYFWSEANRNTDVSCVEPASYLRNRLTALRRYLYRAQNTASSAQVLLGLVSPLFLHEKYDS